MTTTALVVDDHPSFRRFARTLLEDAGLVVVGVAGDGAAALDAVRELRPDVVPVETHVRHIIRNLGLPATTAETAESVR